MSRYHERPSRLAGIDACWSVSRGARANTLVEADACVDVVVWLTERGPRLHVEPATAAALQLSLSEDDEVLGIRLAPGHGEPLRQLAPALREAVTSQWRNGVLAPATLEALVASRLRPPPTLITDFIESARTRRGQLRLSGAGERTLQRTARTWLGLRPKTLLRIERAREASRALRTGEPAVDVALRLGFADQPHLTRELRALLGRTPSEIFKTVAAR